MPGQDFLLGKLNRANGHIGLLTGFGFYSVQIYIYRLIGGFRLQGIVGPLGFLQVGKYVNHAAAGRIGLKQFERFRQGIVGAARSIGRHYFVKQRQQELSVGR
ncbi:hypothetical protein ES707_10472 [subsurface metagenome]